MSFVPYSELPQGLSRNRGCHSISQLIVEMRYSKHDDKGKSERLLRLTKEIKNIHAFVSVDSIIFIRGNEYLCNCDAVVDLCSQN